MGMFIDVAVQDRAFLRLAESRKLVEACPVEIFKIAGGEVIIDPEQEDECILCGRCLEIAKGKLKIIKHYE